MYASKLTQKYQTTIPAEIRKKLDLKSGDLVGFAYINGQVILKKIDLLDLAFSHALEETLEEWSSKVDQEAYSGL